MAAWSPSLMAATIRRGGWLVGSAALMWERVVSW